MTVLPSSVTFPSALIKLGQEGGRNDVSMGSAKQLHNSVSLGRWELYYSEAVPFPQPPWFPWSLVLRSPHRPNKIKRNILALSSGRPEISQKISFKQKWATVWIHWWILILIFLMLVWHIVIEANEHFNNI